jgi:hypothetical protein
MERSGKAGTAGRYKKSGFEKKAPALGGER